MRVMSNGMREIFGKLPLAVSSVVYADPCLIIIGPGWRLRLLTAWRVVDTGIFVMGSDEVDAALLQTLFTGNEIVDCRSQSSTVNFDPALVFSTGHVLEVFSVSAVEPWIFSVDGIGPFVASPSG